MKPEEIIENVRKKYRECSSYTDEGHADVVWTEGESVTVNFKTFFHRPGRFRSEWQDFGPNRGKTDEFSLLCIDQDETFMCRKTRNKSEVTQPPLDITLARATGCSAGAATLIFWLLDNRDNHILQCNPVTDNIQLVDKNPEQYSLKINKGATKTVLIEINSTDFAIRKIDQQNSISGQQLKKLYADFEERERLLASKLNRPQLDPNTLSDSAKIESRTVYSFTDISFDSSLASDIFRRSSA